MNFSASVEILVAESNNGLVSKADWWDRIPLLKVAKVLNGFPFKSEFFSAQNGVPIIRIRDVTSGSISTFYTGVIPEDYWVDKGDIIIGMDGDFNCR
jgi:type I restriction enzyme S subunit